MYTLVNGKKVENLTYADTGVGAWMMSPYFWWNDKKVTELYNSETGEIKWCDANGDEILMF